MTLGSQLRYGNVTDWQTWKMKTDLCILSTACFPSLSLLVMHIDLCSAWLPSLPCAPPFPQPPHFKVSYSGHWDHLKLSFSSGSSSLGQRTAVSRFPPCLKVWLVSKPWIQRGDLRPTLFPCKLLLTVCISLLWLEQSGNSWFLIRIHYCLVSECSIPER